MIFDIQRYSLHDGPGLRTIVFLKGCPLRCTWCSNPESQNPSFELFWSASRCLGCGDCLGISDAMSKEKDTIIFHPEKVSNANDYRFVCPSRALEVVGKDSTSQEILHELLKDKVFYRDTGGVTLSGGEPLLQPALCQEIAQGCRKEKIALAVETCLYVPWENIEMMVPWTDEFLCDVKHVDEKIFRRQTGGNIALVWDNLIKLADTGAKIRARIPVIEGFNHTDGTMEAILERLAPLESVYAIDFMPYHSLGAAKYKKLGRSYGHPESIMPESEVYPYVEKAKKIKKTVTIGG